MNGKIRENETSGSIDQRLLALENNKWEAWFGKHPGVVLGIVITALCTSFWYFHTWQVERMDKNHQTELTNLKKQNQDKINWLKEKQKANLSSAKEKCGIEKERINNKLLQCETVTKKHNKSLNQIGAKDAPPG